MIIGGALVHRLVDIQIPFVNLEVETTGGVGTDPGLICYSRPLGSIIREWNKLALAALTTFRPRCYFHRIYSYTTPRAPTSAWHMWLAHFRKKPTRRLDNLLQR